MRVFDPNPFWTALTTSQRTLAVGSPPALRFPKDVIPFAATETQDARSACALHELLAPGEAAYVAALHRSSLGGLELVGTHPCLQMHFGGPLPDAPAPAGAPAIEELALADAPEMLALTRVAFPGFFRYRTPLLGRYFGIRHNTALVAMAGERLSLPGAVEISAVCTHPAHVGRGYAARLVTHLLQLHQAHGVRSMLHVLTANHRAVALYGRLGFSRAGEIPFQLLRRTRDDLG